MRALVEAVVNRALAPLRTRVANLVARAVVKVVKDSDDLQLLQLAVLDGETRDQVERLQEYGFTSYPWAGAEAAVVFVGGRRDHGLVLAVDDRRHRLAGLAEGDSAIYRSTGEKVHVKDGVVVAKATEVRMGGDTASKALALAVETKARLDTIQSAFDGHTHVLAVVAASGTGGTATAAPPANAIGSLASIASTVAKTTG